jgi:xanthine dehydrogenase accessory factor
VTPERLAALAEARAAKRPVVLATRIPSGEQVLLPADGVAADLADAAARALERDESGSVTLADGEWFLHVFNPPLRLIVIGAVHIAQALVALAAPLGIATIVVDPRRTFASAERFPAVTLCHEWPDEALDGLGLDQRSAVVALTHDPKLDDPALDRALRSPAYYIGALGSRKTHAARLGRLAERGHDAASLARIRGPVGLALAAVTAPEIALSIVAELVAVRRHAPLAERPAPA